MNSRVAFLGVIVLGGIFTLRLGSLFEHEQPLAESYTLPQTSSAIPVLPSTPNKPQGIAKGWGEPFDTYLVDYTQPIHITHVFSSYAVAPNSKQFKELSVVQLSWLRAAQFARTKGIQVEFLDCTLPEDALGSPVFSTRRNLTWNIQDIRKQDASYIPTIGEYYKLAFEYGAGEVVVGTNLDIGVSTDFYLRAHEWATKDYTQVSAQLVAMKEAAKYYLHCYFAAQIDSTVDIHQSFCVDDTEALYVNFGGFKPLWEHVRLDIGRYAARLHLESTGQTNFELISRIAPQDDEELFSLQQFEPQGPSENLIQALRTEAWNHFGGTITRVDVSDTILTSSTREAALKSALMFKSGQIHPGNDCFVMTRLAMPRLLRQLPHPAGLRPFGSWIPHMFIQSGIPFRRIDATPKDAWTFHIGKGLWGNAQDQFRARLEANPLFFLFLAGNFNALDPEHLLLQHQFLHAPQSCLLNGVRGWRQFKYCKSTSPVTPCVGKARHACERFQHLELRDGQLYLEHCKQLAVRRSKVQEPVCSLCHFFFQLQHLSTKLECLPGQMEFCDHLPRESCATTTTTTAINL